MIVRCEKRGVNHYFIYSIDFIFICPTTRWIEAIKKASTLGQIGLGDTGPAPAAALADDYWPVRQKASKNLGKLWTESVVEAGAHLLDDALERRPTRR